MQALRTRIVIPAVHRPKRFRNLAATIHPLNQDAILEAFHLDPEAIYGDFSITCGEAVTNMATALKLTLYGSNIGWWEAVLVPAGAMRRWQPSPCPRWDRWAAIPTGAGTVFPAVWSGVPVLSPGAMPRWLAEPRFSGCTRAAWLVPVPRPVGRPELCRHRPRGRHLF